MLLICGSNLGQPSEKDIYHKTKGEKLRLFNEKYKNWMNLVN